MDDELSRALARLVLVAGSVSKAQEHLQKYSVAGQNSDLGDTVSHLSSDSDVIPPRIFLLPATNPWQEEQENENVDLTTTNPPRSGTTSHRQIAWDRRAQFDKTSPGGRENHIPTGEFPSTRGNRPRAETSWSPTTPIRTSSARMPSTVGDLSPLSVDCMDVRTLSPFSSPASPPSHELGQPLSRHKRGTLRNLEFEHSRRGTVNSRLRPAPVMVSEPHGCLPIQANQKPRRPDLHPELAAITPKESKLSWEAFEEVKAKIRMDPEFLGERDYIKIANPNLEISQLIHHPPLQGVKWYIVTVGRSIGIYNSWGLANVATSGVRNNHHKSYCSREEAIVEYQRLLLQGCVVLMNEKEDRV